MMSRRRRKSPQYIEHCSLIRSMFWRCGSCVSVAEDYCKMIYVGKRGQSCSLWMSTKSLVNLVCALTCVSCVRSSQCVTSVSIPLKAKAIDLFRGACAVKGNVQVAGHVKPAPFSRRDVTLGDVDGSLFHIKIRFFIGHHDQYGHNWGNISQFAMWLSQSSVYIDKNWSVNVPISAFGGQIWQSYE